MQLQQKLSERKKAFLASGKATPEMRAIMQRSTDQLRASGIQQRMLKAGQKAPFFELPNQVGQMVDSSAMLAKGPLVLSYFRGVWWPYCILELEALNEVLPQIKSVEGSLIVISPQLESFSKEMAQKLKLEFDILSDRHNDVATQFGLTFTLPEELQAVYRKFGIDLAHFNGDDSWTLPMPARFIVDRQSTIRSAEADPDYTVRPEPEDTVRTLRELMGFAWTA